MNRTGITVFVVIMVCFAALAVEFSLKPLRSEDAPLEESVQNEVDRAVSLGEAWLAENKSDTNEVSGVDLFVTNSLSRRRIAVKLVSSQKNGHWHVANTNFTDGAATRLAIRILNAISSRSEEDDR